MDIEKLIERLTQYSQSLIAYELGADFADACMDAATALSTLQAENEELRAELADLRAQWDMYGGDDGITAIYAELERVKAERDAAIKKFETEKEDFLDYALSGTQNAAPFCRNRHPDCVDKRGWCIPVKCHGFSRDEED